jgi:hypothetical protein
MGMVSADGDGNAATRGTKARRIGSHSFLSVLFPSRPLLSVLLLPASLVHHRPQIKSLLPSRGEWTSESSYLNCVNSLKAERSSPSLARVVTIKYGDYRCVLLIILHERREAGCRRDVKIERVISREFAV